MIANKSKIKCGGVLISVLIILTFFVIPALSADIYVYRDSQGILHFTNAPTSLKFKSYMRESGPNTVTILPDVSFDDVIAEAAVKNDLSFYLIKALIHVESYFNPYAVSKKGALGLMQIMPQNLETLNVDHPFDPRENVMGGASYLKNMLKRFDGKLELALAAYNAGPTVVEKYSAVPPFRETQEYVQRVLKQFKQYKDI